jgi:hypothetical protein
MVEHYLVESISSSATFLDEESFDHLIRSLGHAVSGLWEIVALRREYKK